MRLDLIGRIRNTSLPYGNAFIPLFEAVINSIHSTEDRFRDQVAAEGKVVVRISRVPPEPTLPGVTGRPPIPEISSITISDNGMGFTDENLESFATADSTAKSDRGGKGVGRFTWLVVFDEARIESTIQVDGTQEQRRFRFLPSKNGIEDYFSGFTTGSLSTSVSLVGVKKRYAEALRMGADTIADRLFEHCFNYFVLGRCPEILLVDDGVEEPISMKVNDRLHEVRCESPVPLKVGKHPLEVLHIRRKFSAGRRHEAHLCANKRVVESFSLVEYSGLSPEPYRDSSTGESVVHHVYVSGKAFDEAVDTTRTRLDLPDGAPLLEAGGALDLKTLRQQLGSHVDEHLADILRADREENFKRVQSYIRIEQPEYRHLLTHKKDALERIRWADDPRRLDETLYRVQQEWDLEVRQRQQRVVEQGTESTDPQSLAEELAKIIAEVNEQGQANLVRYVAKRKAVLQLLRKLISVTSGPALEERIHRVIFPLRKNADDIGYEDHNLWLVDDTLSFYEFIFSDKPLSTIPQSGSESTSRPDLLAFKTGDPYHHVAIIEFKRPDRYDENPVQQMVDYSVLLRDGGAKDSRGVTMTGVPKSVRIDGYAICTLTPDLEKLIRRGPGNMEKVAQEGRWYGSVPNENLWLEVIDFQAFIRRAEQRNHAFFKKLGLE